SSISNADRRCAPSDNSGETSRDHLSNSVAAESGSYGRSIVRRALPSALAANAMKKVLLEGLIIAVVGCAIAFCGNALSSRGLNLTQDFFHHQTATASNTATPSITPQPVTSAPNALATATPNAAWEELSARVTANRLSLINA